jgi:hypothetical protein
MSLSAWAGNLVGTPREGGPVAAGRYEIRVKGRLSGSLQSAFPDLTTQVEPVETVLSGTFDDQAELYGVLAQIEGLGLELVEVRHLADGTPAAESPARKRKPADE